MRKKTDEKAKDAKDAEVAKDEELGDAEDEELGNADADIENAENSDGEPWIVQNILNPLTETLTSISEKLDSQQNRLEVIEKAMKSTAAEGSSIPDNLSETTNIKQTNKATSKSEKTETQSESPEESPDKKVEPEQAPEPEKTPDPEKPKRRTIIRL